MRAEYDFDNNAVLHVDIDGRITTVTTVVERSDNTEWLPMERVLPEGYDPRFAGVLADTEARYTFDGERRVVLIEYPQADFSPGAIRSLLKQQAKGGARARLGMTDWAVIRSIETGVEIPETIRAERDAVRKKSEQIEKDIDATPEGRLHDFQVTYGDEPGRVRPTPVPRPQAERVTDPALIVPEGNGSEWVTDATGEDEEGKPVRPATTKEKAKGRKQ